jgi:hypothetical protein
VKNKGLLFTIDAILALLFIIILLIILSLPILENTKDVEKILINNRISDLLITSQLLEINEVLELEKNYLQLFGKKSGYITINSKKIEINSENKIKTRLISQNIRYINSSNKQIYIEIGVYY